MKKIVLIHHTLLVILLVWIQINPLLTQPAIQWQKAFGGSLYDEPRVVRQTRDGGFIVSGYTLSDDGDVQGSHGFNDFWLLKLDSIGGLQWKKTYGGSNHDRAFNMDLTNDGGSIIVGLTKSNDGDVFGYHGDFDVWIIKLDSLGNLQWQKCLGGNGWEEAWDVKQTIDGGFIVAGRSGLVDGDVTVNHGASDYWVVKLSVDGVIEWQKSFGGSGMDNCYSIAPTSDGGYILAGESQSNDGNVSINYGNSDYWVVKLDIQGKIEWEKSYGGMALDRANDILQTRDGGYIVFGQSASNDGDVTGAHGGYDNWVVKLDKLGELEWQKALGGSDEDFGQSIQQVLVNGYVMIGFSSSSNGDVIGNDGGKDFWIVRLSEFGDVIWQKTLGGTNAERGFSIEQTDDLGYIVAGEAWSNNGDVSGVQGYNDFWVVKLSPESTPSSEVQSLALEIYPNPAIHSIRIKLPVEASALQITITDLLGREMRSQALFNSLFNAWEINISNLMEGFYFLSATTPDGKNYFGKFKKE